MTTVNPKTTSAGYDVIKHGGTVADPAIALLLMGIWVEPTSSGIRGGTSMVSGLHAIVISPNGLTGGADPRREGLVMGE